MSRIAIMLCVQEGLLLEMPCAPSFATACLRCTEGIDIDCDAINARICNLQDCCTLCEDRQKRSDGTQHPRSIFEIFACSCFLPQAHLDRMKSCATLHRIYMVKTPWQHLQDHMCRLGSSYLIELGPLLTQVSLRRGALLSFLLEVPLCL